jgi:predicted dehydrogenase
LKPLSLYIREGRALINAARQFKRIVQTGTQQRTMEMNRFSCELVRDGGIGKVKAIECVNFTGPIDFPAEGLPRQPVPAGLDWNLWQGQTAERPYSEQLASH